MAEPFRVLMVCTGNICRSPMAERLLTGRLAERFPDAAAVDVRSAGTWGHEGSPMEPFAEQALRQRGQDPDGFVARELTAPMVAGAGLVLGATREHRAAAVTLHPRASGWTFTLREFARLAQAVDPGAVNNGDLAARLRALVPAAARQRGIVRAPSPDADDIADPYRGPAESFERCATQISDAVDAVVEVLAAGDGSTPTAPSP